MLQPLFNLLLTSDDTQSTTTSAAPQMAGSLSKGDRLLREQTHFPTPFELACNSAAQLKLI